MYIKLEGERDSPPRICAGFERIVEKEAGTFKYFLKIVPTEYVNLRSESPTIARANLDSPCRDVCYSSVHIFVLPHP